MSRYDWFFFAHILAAIIWVGGAFVVNVLAFRIEREGDALRIAAFARDAEVVAMRVFAPASLALVAFGFALIAEGNWDYKAWIVIGLVMWGLSFVTGIAFLGPESGRIAKVVSAEGPASPEAQRRIRRILWISRIELLLLLFIVFDMVWKPGV